MNTRPILLTFPYHGRTRVIRVEYKGRTFQGYFKYEVTFNDTGAYIYHYQTDDATRYGIIQYLNDVLPSLLAF